MRGSAASSASDHTKSTAQFVQNPVVKCGRMAIAAIDRLWPALLAALPRIRVPWSLG